MVSCPRVTLSKGCLDSCIKFKIEDKYGHQVMVLKFYDKMLDLMGRDGYKLLGSRFYQIV